MIKKEKIKIYGMTCNHCKKKIESRFRVLKAVKECNVDLVKGIMVLECDSHQLPKTKIKQNIQELGYDVKSRNRWGFDLFIYGILIFIFYKLFNNNISYSPQLGNSGSYGLLFLTGLLSSFHCISMCGGICVSQSIKSKSSGLVYNLGRVISYTIIGGIVGQIGSIISFSNETKALIQVIAGLFMILMALNLLGIFPLWMRLQKLLPNFKMKKGNKSPFIIGLLNGFMPCGPLQTMQLYALSTGNAVQGAIAMFFFAAGTLPLMAGVSLITSIINKKNIHKMFKFSGIMVLVLGLVMADRGLSLIGISFNPFEKAEVSVDNSIELIDGYQYIELIASEIGYSPKTLFVSKDYPVRLNIIGKSLNNCNNTILIPKLGIETKLQSGNNIIEFTPQETGELVYTCWMGMLTGKIKIVDSLSQIKVALPIDIEGFQEVKMYSDEKGFYPNIILVETNKTVRWIIEGKNLNVCNNKIVFPEENKYIDLQEGENVIEVTTEQEGELVFTCGMGMLYGKLVFVNEINSTVIEKLKNSKNN